MKPEDKFGNPIYPHIFAVLQRYGSYLESSGWRESKNKPNLFWKSFNGISVFADMRGTDIVKIWEDPCPMIYAHSEEHEDWKKRRVIRYATEECDALGVPYRFSFYEDCEPDGLMFGDDDELANGMCKLCHEEIDRDGLFCSDKCQQTYNKLIKFREEINSKEKCSICGCELSIFSQNTIRHHVDYDKDKTIWVCRSCHRKIHANKVKYPNLAPVKPKEP
jgi:hypothetical protein